MDSCYKMKNPSDMFDISYIVYIDSLGSPFPHYSHTNPSKYGNGMGRGVPTIGVGRNP